MNMARSRFSFFLVFVSGIYLTWSSIFIYYSSFIAIDGQRYFSLVDDAMISMRYAWNLSHGYGLVWNPNEYVEGYSNLLMTLLMSLATRFLDKRMAVLSIQILGIAIVFICAMLTRELAKHIFRSHPQTVLLQNLSFVSVLFYYNLSFWSLMGMETGLLTALLLLNTLLAIRWIDTKEDHLLYLSAIAGGLAFLTRNDALVFSGLLFLFLLWCEWIDHGKKENYYKILISVLIFSSFVLGLTFFRWSYYGELLPNTYVLKVGSVPWQIRVNDGILYVFAFAKETIVSLLFALIGVVFMRDRISYLFLALFGVSIAYQIWTGGDAWDGWRFILPSLPLIFILSVSGVSWASRTLHEKTQIRKHITQPAMITTLLAVLLIGSLILPFRNFILFHQEETDFRSNDHNIDVALAINAVATPDARIGVFYAGLIPYYTGKYSIDFLGKSDKYIAEMYPHLPDKIVWLHPITLPGHNKYDLNYSIKTLKPDYIQRFYWSGQNIRTWAIEQYVRLEYQDVGGTITLIVKKDSPHIDWTRGKIIPWGGQS